MPSGADAAWDRSADVYDQVLAANRRGAERLVMSLPDGPHPRVLDVGCGTGFASLAMVESRGARELAGVDPSEEMVRRYEERLAAAAPGARVSAHVAGVDDMPVAEGSFDAVVSSMAFHWFPDKTAALRAMCRALRPGGVLGVLGSGRGTDREFRDLISGIRPPVPAALVDIYDELQRDEREMAVYLEEAGLEALDVWMEVRHGHLPPEAFLARKEATTGHLLDPLPEEERAAVRKRIATAVRDAAGPRGFAYTFCKLYAVARRPG